MLPSGQAAAQATAASSSPRAPPWQAIWRELRRTEGGFLVKSARRHSTFCSVRRSWDLVGGRTECRREGQSHGGAAGTPAAPTAPAQARGPRALLRHRAQLQLHRACLLPLAMLPPLVCPSVPARPLQHAGAEPRAQRRAADTHPRPRLPPPQELFQTAGPKDISWRKVTSDHVSTFDVKGQRVLQARPSLRAQSAAAPPPAAGRPAAGRAGGAGGAAPADGDCDDGHRAPAAAGPPAAAGQHTEGPGGAAQIPPRRRFPFLRAGQPPDQGAQRAPRPGGRRPPTTASWRWSC